MKETNDDEFNIKVEIFDIVKVVKKLLNKEEYEMLQDYIDREEKRLKENVYIDQAEIYVDKLISGLK